MLLIPRLHQSPPRPDPPAPHASLPPHGPAAAGAYIVDNGRTLILWVGQAAPPTFYQQAFGLQGPPQDATGAGPCCVRSLVCRAPCCHLPSARRLPLLLPNDCPCALPAGLSPEPARPGSELSARINGVLRQLRGRKELWQVRGGGRAASGRSHALPAQRGSAWGSPHRGVPTTQRLLLCPSLPHTPLPQECWTIRQGTPMEAHVMPLLVEDRQVGLLPGGEARCMCAAPQPAAAGWSPASKASPAASRVPVLRNPVPQATAGSQAYLEFMLQLQKMIMAKA